MSAPCSSGRHRCGAGERRVDHQRDAGVVRDLRERLEVGDRARRVGDDLGVEQLRAAGLDRGGERVGAVGGHERGLDPEPPQRHVEQRVGAAVERGAGDDVLAGLGELGDQQRLGGLAAGGGDRADPALEAGDALLERRDGRVAEPRVDVPVLLEREQVGGVLDVLEHERGRLVDRHLARAGGRIGPAARVDRARPLAPDVVLDRRHAGEGSKLMPRLRSARSAPARCRGRRAGGAWRRPRRTRSGRTRTRAGGPPAAARRRPAWRRRPGARRRG